MSESTADRAPLGWYPDPDRAGEQRWWNGSAWSGHTRADPDYVPPAGSPEGADVPSTAAQLLMVFQMLPGLLVVSVVMLTLVATGARSPSLVSLLLIAGPLAGWAVCGVLVVVDRDFLVRYGIDPPSPAYILLAPPIAYMAVRTTRLHVAPGQSRSRVGSPVLVLAITNLALAGGIGVPLLLA